MALAKTATVLFMVMAFFEISFGAVYKVGGSAGWTIGKVDYKKWASSKNFHVGDTIVFEYDPRYHNLMRVTHKDFRTCNSKAPIAIHATGNDSITFKRPGHYYYICSHPFHCPDGQKVDIRVTSADSPAASPSPATYESLPFTPPSGDMNPGHFHSSASSLHSSMRQLAITVTLAVSMVAYFVAN